MQMHTEASLMWACLWWVSWFGSFSSTIKLQLLIQRAPGAWHMFLHIFCFKVNKLFLAPWLEVKLGFFFPLIEELRCPKSTLSSSIGLLVSAAKSCQTLLQPHGLPGSSVLGIFQARILEKVAIPFSRGSFRPRDWTQDYCIAGRFFFFFSHLSHQGKTGLVWPKIWESWPRQSQCHCQCRTGGPGTRTTGAVQRGAPWDKLPTESTGASQVPSR